MTYPLITKTSSLKSKERVVTLEYDTGDTVRLSLTTRQTTDKKGKIRLDQIIKDQRSFRGMTSHINEQITENELSIELSRLLTPTDASNAFDFLLEKKISQENIQIFPKCSKPFQKKEGLGEPTAE